MADTVPSTPTPSIAALVGGLIRSALLLAAGLGLYHGATIDDGTLSLISSAVVALGTTGWSLVAKWRAAQAAHSGAVNSAVARTPVQPK